MKHKHQRNKIQSKKTQSAHKQHNQNYSLSNSGHRRHNNRSAVSTQVRRQKRLRCVLTVILLILLAVLGAVIFYKQKVQKQERAHITATKQAKEKKAEEEQAKAAEQKAKAEEAAKKKAAEAKNSRLNRDVQTAENTATEQDHKTNGLSICMYHYVYDKNNPPKEQLNNNFIEVHDLEAELKYLTENNYYFPTWEEVRKYVKGELLLPLLMMVRTVS